MRRGEESPLPPRGSSGAVGVNVQSGRYGYRTPETVDVVNTTLVQSPDVDVLGGVEGTMLVQSPDVEVLGGTEVARHKKNHRRDGYDTICLRHFHPLEE